MLNGGPMAANELPTIAKETQCSWIGSLYVRGPVRLGSHGAGPHFLRQRPMPSQVDLQAQILNNRCHDLQLIPKPII